MPYKNGNASDGSDGVLLSTNGNKVVIVGGNNQTGEKEWIPLDGDGKAGGGDEANGGGGVMDAFRRRASSLNIGRGSHHGFSLGIAIIFIIGECAGSGVLALPKAMADMGWASVFVMVACCLASSYSGVFLAKCWIIVEERYEEYRGKTRNPYPAIGEIAIGKWMSYLVSFSVNFTLFGVSVVYLLLCAQTFQSMLRDYVDYTFCIWILIFGAILCPLMWLGTPEDFWPSALLALLTTAIACVLLLVNIIMDGQELSEPAKFPAPTFSSFFLSFGTILFTFGGAAAFPTFQNDMKDKKKFPTAVIVGFLGLLFLYLPVSISGYAVFGGDVKENVVRSISDGPMKLTADILLAGHFFFAFLILINPTAQEIEDVFHVPKRFNYKRIIVRSLLMVTVVFVAETIPQFSKILSLVGGSTVTLTSYVFPAIFYMKLCSQTHPDWPERKCSLYEKIYLVISIILGAIGGGIATYSAISDIIRESSFSPPCYIPHPEVFNVTSGNDTLLTTAASTAAELFNSSFV